ncbi:MAG: hypothetical protein EOM34_12020 [Clostridia bacterium]|nr:hypothetical protein [Lachnospiraceae bacterium]NCC01380.1 hypothetical protein [Clostridia bacterium]NCD03203.1 hypothetical protein [Clostridia bacterium]
MKDYCNTDILANYFRGPEAVGGKIYFDETGMTFKSHKLNIQRGETRIEYRDICKVGKRNTLGLVPNGIYVFTRDGFEHKFVIYSRKAVLEYLQSKIAG